MGKETFQIAPIATPTMTMRWRPMETGRVMYFWIPILCFFDSTTVVSNIASALLRARRGLLLVDDLQGAAANLVRLSHVLLSFERIGFCEGLLPPQEVEVGHRLEVVGLHVDGVLQRPFAFL